MSKRSPAHALPPVTNLSGLPYLLTPAEAAALLRTTRGALYARAERGLLPGAVKDGRRLLVRRDDLLRSLAEGRAPSPGGSRR
ncbi:MAG: helix-turn-helix domain-containing protein [Myxococcales bacterium]|nr:helix-turn-helix domain-containing protein [Myxococcales bacterium]